MSRPYEGAPTCEACPSIDVRIWHRQGLLRPGRTFPYSWSQAGEQRGTISVRTERSAAVLSFRARDWGAEEWKSVNQRVPIAWTACHFGGHRPWFCCTRCGRRVAKVFLAGHPFFACRHCYGLGYESRLESVRLRGLGKARKIRMKMGGDANVLDDFPPKPKGMHRRTYARLRHVYEVTVARL
jgi:hypothetical protein